MEFYDNPYVGFRARQYNSRQTDMTSLITLHSSWPNTPKSQYDGKNYRKIVHIEFYQN